MSRKTKEEKKLAEYRRRLKFLQGKSPLREESSGSVNQSSAISPEKNKQLTETDLKQQSFFRQDLKKSLVYISLIITLEIIIYFARMNRYF